MDLFEAVNTRRSFRTYSDKPVTDETLEKCLDAARWAPSWANTQCTRFIVVKDAGMKAAISEKLPERNPARRAVAKAPVVVVFVAELGAAGFLQGEECDDKAWYMYDVGLASQNFCLAAHALGLGTVIVGLMDYRAIGELLGVGRGFQVVALTPLGVPTGGDRPPVRKELSELIHKEKWEK